MATVDWSATSDWPAAAITTNGKDVWYVATESEPASAFSNSHPRDKEWMAYQWFDMAAGKFISELETVSFEEKDHLAELEELFEI